MHKKWQLAVGTLSVLFATATMTSAANILWDPVGTVEGTQSILTEGVLAQAINATNSGVDHTVTAGAEVITFTSRSPILASITGDQVFEPPRTFDPEFDLILGSHTWQGGGGQFEIENLVPGTNYAVQIFGVMDGRGCCAARDTRFSDGTGLGSASDNVTRGDGEFVIGRFVADSATQVIEALPGDGGGGTDPGLSAYVVRALVDTGVDLFPVLEINRDTGNATLRNNTANDLTISTLSIRSTRGSLNPAQWNSISGNQDSNNGGGFDPDDEWYQFAPGSANELSEGTLGAQTLVKQSTVVNLGNIWSKNPVENDLSGRMLLSDNETLVNLQIRFTGNGGEAFAIGDLNFDGSVNALDWSIHRDNAFSDMSGLNLVQSYQRGDYDGDGDSDLDDFSTFVNAYEAANGAGSFAALNSVPEPTFALLLMPILGALAWGRRRIKATTVLALVVTATVLVMQATPAQAVLLPGSATNVAIGGTASQSSNYSDTDFLADLGIDGNIYNFTHTINTDETPSWQVSLAGGSTDIGTIVLHNRDSCCQLRLQDITVTVRNAADTQDLYVSPVLNPGNVLNNPDRIELNLVELTGGTINGGVVKVSRTPIPGLANDDGRVLSLGEVQVFGPGANVRPNIAPLGTATQSSNFNGTFVAGLAIDGSLSNFTHTASGDAAATWTLDLGLESQIDGVALWNRGGGCCPERMRDITLDVLASDGTTVVRSTTLNQGNALGSPLVVSDNMLGQDIVGRYIRVSRTPDPLGVSTDDMNVLSLGEVEVFGEIPQLKIVVNRTTGAIELQNNSFAPLDIRAYAIESTGGSLKTAGWNSLQDQDLEGNGAPGTGNGWEEAGGSGANALAEFYLTGSSSIGTGFNRSMGTGYNPSVDAQDLSFTYQLATGQEFSGVIEYVTGGVLAGDYNHNGSVDAADYTIWKDNFGSSTNLDADGNGNGTIDAADYTVWKDNFGNAAAAASTAAVPEPTTGLLMFSAISLLFGFRRRKNVAAVSTSATGALAVATVGLLVASTVASARGVDRSFQFGDETSEGASVGAGVGTGNSFGTTFDSEGTPNTGDLNDLRAINGPTYVNVTTPDGSSLGIRFDGVDDYLEGDRLGLPSTNVSSTGGTPAGPLDYTGIANRGFQLWVRPDATAAGSTQAIVRDTNQHGAGISSGNNWVLRYAGADVDSGVPVDFGTWSHVMVVRPNGAANGARMFVNGVAVATGGGGYDGADNSPLVVGSNTGDLTNTFPGADSFFKGDLDSLELFVLGKSQTNSVEYGNFSLATDNWFVADALSGVNPGDINGDGSVNGNGSGSVATDDVSAFIANWRHENRVNGLIVGDLNSRGFGDLNMDGITDELDWGILRANHPGASNLNLGALLNGVATPEPTSAVLGLLGLIGLSVIRRRS